MDTGILTLTNLETGELLDTRHKLPDKKFPIRGYHMYNNGVKMLHHALSKQEFDLAIDMFTPTGVDRYNMLVKKFKFYTESLNDANRSRFKRKLLENRILGEHNKRLMLNPFIFLPKGDKNIRDSKYLTQRMWKYLFEDVDSASEEVIEFTEEVFGVNKELLSDYIMVGKKEYMKKIKIKEDK